jgi:hypothetical protein
VQEGAAILQNQTISPLTLEDDKPSRSEWRRIVGLFVLSAAIGSLFFGAMVTLFIGPVPSVAWVSIFAVEILAGCFVAGAVAAGSSHLG